MSGTEGTNPGSGAPAPQPAATTTVTTEAPKTFGELEERTTQEQEQPRADLDEMLGVKKPGKKEPAAPASDDDDEDFDDLEDDDEDFGDLEDGDGEDDDSEESDDEESDVDEDDEGNEEDSEEDLGEITKEDLQKKIKFKVNGKETTVTLEQARHLLSSGWHNKSKVTEFETYKKTAVQELGQVKAELAVANSKITPAWEAIKKKDIKEAIFAIAENAGMNKLEVRTQLRDQMEAEIFARYGIDPKWVERRKQEIKPQLDALDFKERSAFLEEENKKLKEPKKPTQDDEVTAIQQKFKDLMMEHGISKMDLRKAHEWIEKNTSQGQEPNLDPENVTTVVLRMRVVDKAFDAIQSVRPSLKKDEKFVDRVIKKLSANSDWSTAKLARWVYKTAKQSALNSKKQGAEQATRDLSRKALRGKGKSGLENPSVGQKKPQTFNELSATYDDDGRMLD